MKETAPTTSDWKALYQAALEFKEIEAWTWVYDSDVFGGPGSGQRGDRLLLHHGRFGGDVCPGPVPGQRGVGELHASRIRATAGLCRSPGNSADAEVPDGLLRQQRRADKRGSPGDQKPGSEVPGENRMAAVPQLSSGIPSLVPDGRRSQVSHPGPATGERGLSPLSGRPRSLRSTSGGALVGQGAGRNGEGPLLERCLFGACPSGGGRARDHAHGRASSGQAQEGGRAYPGNLGDGLLPLALRCAGEERRTAVLPLPDDDGGPRIGFHFRHRLGLPWNPPGRVPRAISSSGRETEMAGARDMGREGRGYNLLEPITYRLGIKLYIVGELEALEEAGAALGRFMGLPDLP